MTHLEAVRPATRAGWSERALVGLGAAIFFHLLYFKHGVLIYVFNPNGAGLWIDEAYRVWSGEVMYRDFFEFLPPAVVYLNAAVMALFGPRILPLGYLGVALGTLLTLLTHALAARLTSSRWRLLPPALFAPLVYASDQLGDHKWLPLLFGLLALLLLARRTPTGARVLAAGCCAGLGILSTTDLGLGLAVGLAAGLGFQGVGRRGLVTFGSGCAAPVVMVLGWFGLQAGLGTLFHDLIVFPLVHYRSANPFVVFFDLGAPRVAPRALTHLVLGLSSLASALAVLASPRLVAPAAATEPECRIGLRLVACAGVGMALAQLQRAVYPLRLAVASALLLTVLASVLDALARREGLWPHASRALVACLVAGALWSGLGLVYRRQSERELVLETHRAGSILALEALPELSWIEHRTQPGDAVFQLPNKGGHHFLSHTRNATSFARLELGGFNPPQQLERALAEIERLQPQVGLWQQTEALPPFLAANSLEPLYREIRRRYKCEGKTPGGVLLLRRRTGTDPEGGEPC